MNYIKLIVESNVVAGDIVSFNNINNKWEKANTTNEIIGLVCSKPEIGELGSHEAYISFSGVLEAIAFQDIPLKGGTLGVNSGKVYVSEESYNNGRYVLPSKSVITAGSFCKIKL